MISVLDVVENYLTVGHGREVIDLTGRELWDLGTEVQRFSNSYTPPQFIDSSYPLYLGGWPSANFFLADQGQFVLSTLLYAGQVLVKDPVSDWFAPEQYQIEHKLTAREGYLTRNWSAGPDRWMIRPR